jgi:hypothetical protein
MKINSSLMLLLQQMVQPQTETLLKRRKHKLQSQSTLSAIANLFSLRKRIRPQLELTSWLSATLSMQSLQPRACQTQSLHLLRQANKRTLFSPQLPPSMLNTSWNILISESIPQRSKKPCQSNHDSRLPSMAYQLSSALIKIWLLLLHCPLS